MPDEGSAAPAANDDAGQSGDSTQQQSAGKAPSPDEIERIIAGRVNKVRQQYADYDEIRAKAAKADELEQAQQSETDKLRSKAEREQEKRAAAEDRANKAMERANKALIRASVVAAASQANAVDPHDVYTLLMASPHAASISVDDDGNVEGASEALGEYMKNKPHLVKRTGGFDGGRQGPAAPGGPSMNEMIRQSVGISPR